MRYSLFVLLGALGASAQTQPEARDLLLRSDAPLVAARTFRLEGTLAIEASVPGTQTKVETSFSSVYATPSRHRREVRTGQAKTLVVFDGESTWTYYPQSNTYLKSAGGTSLPSDLQFIVYGRNQANLQTAAIQRQESVTFGGSPVMCSVVRAEYAGLPGSANATNVVRTAWIEPVNNIVLRDSWESDRPQPGLSTAMHVLIAYNFSTIEWDRPLAEDLFAFQPPEGSRPVRSFTPPMAMANNPNSPPTKAPLIIVPPNVNLADPMSKSGSPSNGPGSGGGIGSGSGGAVRSGPSPGTFRVGGGVTAPSLVYKVEPAYTEEARKVRLQGTVLLYVQVDPSGKAVNMRVLRSLGFGLDEQAMEAVQKWQFKPGFKDGQPVTVEAQIEVSFRLLGPWLIVRQEYDTATGVTKPVFQSLVLPPDCKGGPVDVTLSLQVGADGMLSDVRIIRGDNTSLGQAAIEAVERWKFLPARLNGVPQAVSGEVELACRH
jgi:TonB family protein